MHITNLGDSVFFKLRKLSGYPCIGFFFQFLYRIYNVIYGASIPLNVYVDRSVNFPHGIHGIFISKDATIGNGVTIFHQVTIGSIQIEGHKKFGAPDVGDNCIIGAGAKIIGRVHVGSNVYIASNLSVSHDVECNVTLAPSPYKVIRRTLVD